MLLKGAAASPGIARGTAFVLDVSHEHPTPGAVHEVDIEAELVRLDTASQRAEVELLALREIVRQRGGEIAAELLDAQILAHHDPVFLRQLKQAVITRRVDAASAVAGVVTEYLHGFEQVADPYLRERAADVRDVGRRIRLLLDDASAAELVIPEGSIIVVTELLPSLTAKLEAAHAAALVAEHGGRMSHAAILARALQIPAVVGIPNALDRIRSGDDVIVDGRAGLVFARPEPAVVAEYERVSSSLRVEDDADPAGPALTTDGVAVQILANIGKSADVDAAVRLGAEGVGLFRTEFAFAIRPSAPSEDDQVEILERVAEHLHPRLVTVRLLDVGGDKPLPYLPLPQCPNPALGRRGLRLLLAHPDLLRTQVRAILRVAARYSVRILIPMVIDAGDVAAIRAEIDAAAAALTADGIPFARPPLGAMIEVPASAIAIRRILPEVDFVSLGTNDLTQYMLAVDREDESMSPHFQPAHPALLDLLQHVIDASLEYGKELSICGAIAADDRYTAILLGLGLRALSVPVGDIPRIRRAVRRTTLAEAARLASFARACSTAAAVEALLDRAESALAPAP